MNRWRTPVVISVGIIVLAVIATTYWLVPRDEDARGWVSGVANNAPSAVQEQALAQVAPGSGAGIARGLAKGVETGVPAAQRQIHGVPTGNATADPSDPTMAGRDAPDAGSRALGPTPPSGSAFRTRHPASQDPGAGTFSIAGAVVDRDGMAVPGVVVEALPYRLFEDDGYSTTLGLGEPRETVTDASGGFRFGGLANGEYELRTVESFDHPVAASIRVRAGSSSIRLPIVVQQEIWVDGYVASTDNAPIDQAQVYAAKSSEPVTVSNPSGLFGFYLLVRSDKGSFLRVSAEGFEDATVSIPPDRWLGTGVARIDVALRPLHDPISVSGTVTDNDGNALPATKIYLRRSGKSHETITNNNGAFQLNGIQHPGSYNLNIPARKGYQAYNLTALDVPKEGIRDLEIVLESIGPGSVHGWMSDPTGAPVRNFTLIARSQQEPFRPIPVTSDGQGYFRIDSIPSGWLRIESESEPRFVIEGIMVEPDEEVEVNPIIERGNRPVSGVVTATEGDPIAGASVRISWRLKEGNVNHQSIRNTVTDADGRFTFTDVSSVTHSLYVNAPGYASKTLNLPPGMHSPTVLLDPAM